MSLKQITTLIGCSLAMALPATAQEQQRPLMKDFMGINAHTIQFDPELYAPVCRLVRDYHPISWDVQDNTGVELQFPKARQFITWKDESGKWKDFAAIPDWKEIYSLWIEHGFEIDVTLTLGKMTPDLWKDAPADAFRYGKEFAKYFGPSGENLVTSFEIGNEPSATFTPDQYMVIFTNMAKGLREGDPKMKILTATTRGGEADKYSFPVEIFKGHEDLYDVLNVHTYSLKEHWPTYTRSHPEDPDIEYQKAITNTIEWRDRNAPGKEVWVTEFGYDASTKSPPNDGSPASKFVMVSDTVQAQWIVRSFLEFSALDVQRAYLYWFNDNDNPSFHSASGITRFLTPKPSYWAMKHLYESLGDYRFNRVEEKAVGRMHIYEYVKGTDANDRVWVLWSPTGSGNELTIDMKFPGKVTKAQRMPLKDGPAEAVDTAGQLTISESPMYVWFTAQ